MNKRFEESSDQDEMRRLRRELAEREWRGAIDRLIDQAQKEGKFDNLPGQGKPLRLNKNPYNKEQALAFELIQNNDFTLPWIAERNELLAARDSFRAGLQQEWRWIQRQRHAVRQETATAQLQQKWTAYLQQQQAVLNELNQKINSLNLSIPVERLEVIKLDLERELQRMGASRTLD